MWGSAFFVCGIIRAMKRKPHPNQGSMFGSLEPAEKPKEWARPDGQKRYVFTARRLADLVRASGPKGMTPAEIALRSGAKYARVLDLLVKAVEGGLVEYSGMKQRLLYSAIEEKVYVATKKQPKDSPYLRPSNEKTA